MANLTSALYLKPHSFGVLFTEFDVTTFQRRVEVEGLEEREGRRSAAA